jgi:transposase
MLYRSTDRLCRAGAPMENLAHSASFHSRDKNAPSNPGTKQSARQAAERFGVGIATAIVWTRRARETGERSARKQGQPKRSKLDPHRDYLLGLVEAEPDVTIAEMQERLRMEAGIEASVGTIWTFLDRNGLTFKKRPPTRPSRTAPTS